ncbi:helix-turn-helix domain-containing protein [Streptomyces sp. NPDC015127]|uniref:helix-turn-helix domain-containing protein n=1 Tax=Streptomyces sp. NPDC015127 TaxID=3364939 RepID=UPI0036FBAFBD
MTDTPRGASTEAFARRLHDLRGRSGRTYGALARRMGVGAATLHRYCSGQTVPMDFAPVERLARLCGCGSDELVELHRLWVLADADRGVRRETGTAEATAAATAETAAEADSSSEAVTGAAAAADRDAGTPPAADAFPEALSAAHRDPEAAPALDAALEAVTSAVAVAGAGAARPTRVPLRSRRPALVASSAAALSLLALLAVLAGFRELGPGGDISVGRGGQDRDPAVSVPPTRPRTSPPGPPAAAGSATAGPRPRSDERTGSGTTAPGHTGGTQGTGTPFAWTVDDHIWRNGCDHAYLLDRDPAAVPPPPAQADAASWAASLGALHAGETQVRITVRGKGPEAVVLESLHVRVVERRTPPEQAVYRTSSGCGGALTPRLFDVDLDASRPVARPQPGNDSGTPLPAVSFPYTVSASDPESLLVSGRTVACDCDWYLELRWSSGERGGSVRIDDDGRPFRTSGVRGRPVHDYDYGLGRWVAASGDGSG